MATWGRRERPLPALRLEGGAGDSGMPSTLGAAAAGREGLCAHFRPPRSRLPGVGDAPEGRLGVICRPALNTWHVRASGTYLLSESVVKYTRCCPFPGPRH